ncbi:MAG: ABC transporter, substrate-binding protein (cluster 5, nickel/peptides/opines), partial [uncultured Acetobacteraceae bacterium]
ERTHPARNAPDRGRCPGRGALRRLRAGNAAARRRADRPFRDGAAHPQPVAPGLHRRLHRRREDPGADAGPGRRRQPYALPRRVMGEHAGRQGHHLPPAPGRDVARRQAVHIGGRAVHRHGDVEEDPQLRHGLAAIPDSGGHARPAHGGVPLRAPDAARPAAAGADGPRLRLAQARVRDGRHPPEPGQHRARRHRAVPLRAVRARAAHHRRAERELLAPEHALPGPGGVARGDGPGGGGGADGGGADPVQPLFLADHRRHAAPGPRPPLRGDHARQRGQRANQHAGVQLPPPGAGRPPRAPGGGARLEHPVLHRELPRPLRQGGHRPDPVRRGGLLPRRDAAVRLRPRAGEPPAGRGRAPARRRRHPLLRAAAPRALGRGHQPLLHLHPAIAGGGRHPRGDRAAGRGGVPPHRVQRPRLRPRHRLAPVPQRPGGEHHGVVPLRQPARRALDQPVGVGGRDHRPDHRRRRDGGGPGEAQGALRRLRPSGAGGAGALDADRADLRVRVQPPRPQRRQQPALGLVVLARHLAGAGL